MNILGLTITRRQKTVPAGYTSVSNHGGWWPIIRESDTGAWQRNITINVPDALTSGPVFSCVTLIASDVAKVRPKLMQRQAGGVWDEVENPAYSPVLRRPNHYQNRIVFFLSWMISKLTRGNTYVLKKRDARGVVNALYVLDQTRVRPLVAPSGDVYYSLSTDNLSGILEAVAVPAREIIHDIMYPLYHPLCGVSPLHAAGLAALQGLRIQRNATALFDNYSQIGGILSAPGKITDETAKRLEDHWNAHYAGPENAGKVVALGDGLKFEPARVVSPRDAQMTEQSKDAAIEVCNAYHVPAWMAGYGAEPNYNNGEAKYQQYYSQCLQLQFESIELLLDEGLDLAPNLTIEFDVYDGLLRMDTATKMDVATKGLRGVLKPNEARKQFNLTPVAGGDTVYMQQQDFSLAALNKRDASPDPFGIQIAMSSSSREEPPPDDALEASEGEKLAAEYLRKELAA